MDKKITQEDFRKVVSENIEELDMEEEEAIEFAVSQLEAQGVNLQNVIRDVDFYKEVDAISKFKARYCHLCEMDIQDDRLDVDACLKDLKAAMALSTRSTAHKLYAGSMKVHLITIKIAKWNEQNFKILEDCLENLLINFTGYPDLVSEDIAEWLIHLHEKECFSDDVCAVRVQLLCSRILLESIKRHECNKERFFPMMDELIRHNFCGQCYELREVALKCIKELSTDNDIRVTISNAHKRAITLASEYIDPLRSCLKLSSSHKEMIIDLLKAIVSVTVNSQLAMKIFEEDSNFGVVHELIKNWRGECIVLVWIMKYLLGLSGNDDAKCAMTPLIPQIITIIDENMGSESLLQAAFLLISSLALRNKQNAIALLEHMAIDKISQGMKCQKDIKVKKHGLMALRNIASSSKMNHAFFDAGIPELIDDMMKSVELIPDSKAVLIAIGAPVQLEERWTGEKGDILKNRRED